MGRGRRPNMALEPTRALQTQRAFRQRKAEHLANLEESVKLLEQENDKMRKLLHLDSAANRSLKSPNASSLTRSSSPLIASTSNVPRHHDMAAPVPIAPARIPAQGLSSPSVKPTSANQQAGSGIPTPGSSDSTSTCEHCAPIQQANRQLAVAAAQVEAQMAHLQQSIKALRSVLQHHNIPIPATPSADLVASSSSPRESAVDDAHPHAKRLRMGEPHDAADHTTSAHAIPAGIHMTSRFFSANSPAAAYEQSRRPPALPSVSSNVNATQVWHTPSPSAILSAPTPPSASFSPRHLANSNASHVQSPAASTSAIATDDAYYKARHVGARQNSISTGNASQRSAAAAPPVPPASSPARQAAHLPPWSASSSSNQRQHPSGSFAYNSHSNVLGDSDRTRGNSYPSINSAAANSHRRQHEEYPASSASTSEQHSYSLPMQFPPLPPSASGRSPSFSGAGASPSYAPHHLSSYETPHSPRNGFGSGSRVGQSPRERMEEPTSSTSICARPSFSAHTSSSSQGSPSQQPSGLYQRSSVDAPVEAPAKKSCAPSNGNGSKCCPALAPATDGASTVPKQSCGPASSKRGPPKQQDAEAEAEEAKRWTSPPPLGAGFDMRGSAQATGKEGEGEGGKEEEECCFGLVKCDTQGRIII